jgi:hypothetical protein
LNPQSAEALNLRDIHAPADPAFWPPAPGWWLVGGLILILLVLVAVKGLKAWRRQRRRHRVLNQLQALSTLGSGPELAARVSELLKRLALSSFPRREVACLSGRAWLAFLDRTGGNGRFTQGPGRTLAEGPYMATAEFDAGDLVELAKDWVRRNT